MGGVFLLQLSQTSTSHLTMMIRVLLLIFFLSVQFSDAIFGISTCSRDSQCPKFKIRGGVWLSGKCVTQYGFGGGYKKCAGCVGATCPKDHVCSSLTHECRRSYHGR